MRSVRWRSLLAFGWVAACGFGVALLPAAAWGQEEATIHASVTVVSDGPAEVLAETERQVAEFCCDELSRRPDQLRVVIESGVAMLYASREPVESRRGDAGRESQPVQAASWVDVPTAYLRITVAYMVN